MIRFLSSRRRLLRKRMYKPPHKRNSRTYYRENKNLVKPYQNKFKDLEIPVKRKKRRPKREVTGYKMSYRFKSYGNVDDIVEDDEIETSSE